MADLGDYLIKKGVIGPEQLQEAETVSTSRKLKLQDAIVDLGQTLARLSCLLDIPRGTPSLTATEGLLR